MSDWVAIFDVDGTLTDGTFYNDKKGKRLKRFGPDDFDALRELMKHIPVQFITADKKGWDIVYTRIAKEMKFDLAWVDNKPKARWKWIKENFPSKKIIYVGDGIYDWYCLREADFGACPADSLPHVKNEANFISERTGSKRFVADVCMCVMASLLGVKSWDIGL